MNINNDRSPPNEQLAITIFVILACLAIGLMWYFQSKSSSSSGNTSNTVSTCHISIQSDGQTFIRKGKASKHTTYNTESFDDHRIHVIYETNIPEYNRFFTNELPQDVPIQYMLTQQRLNDVDMRISAYKTNSRESLFLQACFPPIDKHSDGLANYNFDGDTTVNCTKFNWFESTALFTSVLRRSLVDWYHCLVSTCDAVTEQLYEWEYPVASYRATDHFYHIFLDVLARECEYNTYMLLFYTGFFGRYEDQLVFTEPMRDDVSHWSTPIQPCHTHRLETIPCIYRIFNQWLRVVQSRISDRPLQQHLDQWLVTSADLYQSRPVSFVDVSPHLYMIAVVANCLDIGVPNVGNIDPLFVATRRTQTVEELLAQPAPECFRDPPSSS